MQSAPQAQGSFLSAHKENKLHRKQTVLPIPHLFHVSMLSSTEA